VARANTLTEPIFPSSGTNSMPHYVATLHALHNLSFSFTITLDKNKTIVDIHYNVDKNILMFKIYN